MSTTDMSLNDRMKRYENIPRISLTRRAPVIIRIDGRAFHTFTRGLDKPFDKVLIRVMQKTMQYLCENIQGCVFGYTQSDEITLVLTDYATPTTDAWFGYNVQKMTSISASMATLAFNSFWEEEYCDLYDKTTAWDKETSDKEIDRRNQIYSKRMRATFDSRAFSLSKDEVVNCLIWRQQDATRNSIEAVGQACFSSSQLHKKTCNMIQDMLMVEKGIIWNDFPAECKRGACCYKREVGIAVPDSQNPDETITIIRKKWYIDHEPPVFTKNRHYIEQWL